MKRYLSHAIQAVLAASLSLLPISVGTVSGRPASSSDCDSRCAVLEGESRYRCLKTCISSSKKNTPVGDNAVKRKMRECEEVCRDFKGIENIRCTRICLDSKKNHPRQKNKPPSTKAPSPCDSRCSILTGPARDNCVMRCERKERYSTRGDADK